MPYLLVLLWAIALHTQAAENTHYDRVMLSVTASTEVRQEKLNAVLFAEEKGLDTARLADAVNQRIALALDLAKNEEGIKARTLGYNSSPSYNKQRIENWRVRQSLELQSNDPTRLGLLIGKLQSDLNVQSINYSVSRQVIANTTDELIDQAIANFRQRASRIAKAWGRDGYRLVQLAIQDRQSLPNQPMPFQGALVRGPGPSATAPPVLEGGEQQVTVTITGTVELVSATPTAEAQATTNK